MALKFDPPNNLIGILEISDNEILFGQDFAYYRGIPPGEYQIFSAGAGGFKLVAPGYGDMSKPGQYGNGALYVPAAELVNLPNLLSC